MIFLCRSIVGDDQTAAPEGPQVLAPASFWPVTFGRSVIMYPVQIFFPFAASIATTLPLKVQHSYAALVVAIDSSRPDTGTYNRPASSLGEPVITPPGCSSARA